MKISILKTRPDFSLDFTNWNWWFLPAKTHFGAGTQFGRLETLIPVPISRNWTRIRGLILELVLEPEPI